MQGNGNKQNPPMVTAEANRLEESRTRTKHWKRWGPYLSERAWGTVREDYSAGGDAWRYFPHEHARSRAYRWNEDGLAGICDRNQYICFALALWNGKDRILKERAFGLTSVEGNHGEDVKEYFYYLDSTPTHSYLKYLYKYPQSAFPYGRLLEINSQRTKYQPEFDLIDTGIFDENRYFDVLVEYAKLDVEDILIRISATNRGPDRAKLWLLPTIWFRNRWTWGDNDDPRPLLHAAKASSEFALIELHQPELGQRWLYCEGSPQLLFTENETNNRQLFNCENKYPYVKDGINDFLVDGNKLAVNPEQLGTKVAANYSFELESGETGLVRLRLTDTQPTEKKIFGSGFEKVFSDRLQEADEFYQTIISEQLSTDERNVMRQAIGGLLWSKQYYHYIVEKWLDGDPLTPPPPIERRKGRNCEWKHLHNSDVISMPDKWEYPWYAAWDLAFHCVPIALADLEFAKDQLILLLREWYMHPNGQLPAYEWSFSDVNPPVHAWAAWRVYKREQHARGQGDRTFLQRVFHKLMLNFTWWVNRKDIEGNNIFEGGFLGLDNIGLFDRSKPLPSGGLIEQSDGTSWMAMYCLNLLTIALELAREYPAYEDVASKFWEHFIHIADAMNNIGTDNIGLWDPQDGFYYDVLHTPNGNHFPLRVRSAVGLTPLFAVQTFDANVIESFPGFKKRLDWFINNRPDLTADIASLRTPGQNGRKTVGLVRRERLRSILRYMLDEEEFLSPYGIRSLSRFHQDHPYVLSVDGEEYRVDYEPAESTTGMFGGNSNWRGPIWFPLNYLIVESLRELDEYYGDDFKIECPTNSGHLMNLGEVATEISQRLCRIFLPGPDGKRPVFGDVEKFQSDPYWREAIPFYEYFNGDTGVGLGASHQTGWTGLVAKLLFQSARDRSSQS